MVQTKLICRLYSATGCQIETSVLDNILMDEDNSFIARDHSSWEFPTGMNWVEFSPAIITSKFSKYISASSYFDVLPFPYDPYSENNQIHGQNKNGIVI